MHTNTQDAFMTKPRRTIPYSSLLTHFYEFFLMRPYFSEPTLFMFPCSAAPTFLMFPCSAMLTFSCGSYLLSSSTYIVGESYMENPYYFYPSRSLGQILHVQ